MMSSLCVSFVAVCIELILHSNSKLFLKLQKVLQNTSANVPSYSKMMIGAVHGEMV